MNRKSSTKKTVMLDSRAEQRKKDLKPSEFGSLLLAKYKSECPAQLTKFLDQSEEKVALELQTKIPKNHFVTSLIHKNQKQAQLIDAMQNQLATIESKVFEQVPKSKRACSAVPSAKTNRSRGQSALPHKEQIKVNTSAMQLRSLARLESGKKMESAQNLVRRLRHESARMHKEVQKSLDHENLIRSQILDKSMESQRNQTEEEKRRMKEALLEKHRKAVKRRRENKKHLKDSNYEMKRIMSTKPLYVKIDEHFGAKQKQIFASCLNVRSQELKKHVYSRDKFREHEIKVLQRVKEREILYNSLKNQHPKQYQDPVKVQLCQKASKMRDFGKIVKEKFVPHLDPEIKEEIEQRINQLEMRDKINPEILQRIEERRGIGLDYLAESAEIGRHQKEKAKTVVKEVVEVAPQVLKAKMEIPKIKRKENKITPQDVLRRIESREINESDYPAILAKLDKQNIASNGDGKENRVETLAGTVKAKLKMLQQLTHNQ